MKFLLLPSWSVLLPWHLAYPDYWLCLSVFPTPSLPYRFTCLICMISCLLKIPPVIITFQSSYWSSVQISQEMLCRWSCFLNPISPQLCNVTQVESCRKYIDCDGSQSCFFLSATVSIVMYVTWLRWSSDLIWEITYNQLLYLEYTCRMTRILQHSPGPGRQEAKCQLQPEWEMCW